MKNQLREIIWKRDKGICQKCQKKLFKIVDPYEELIEELLSFKKIDIYKWIKKCWKCNKDTGVVSYEFAIGYNYHIGDIKKLDEELMKKYQFVQKVFSKTEQTEVIANTCTNCNALQGNWFIMEDIIEMRSNSINMNKLIDLKLPNNLKFEDLPIDKDELGPFEEKLSLLAHIHHKDRNRNNNKIDNLILLCRDCHIKTHSELRN